MRDVSVTVKVELKVIFSEFIKKLGNRICSPVLPILTESEVVLVEHRAAMHEQTEKSEFSEKETLEMGGKTNSKTNT